MRGVDKLFRVPGSGFRVPGSGFRVSGFRFQVSGFRFQVSGCLNFIPVKVLFLKYEIIREIFLLN